MFSLLPLALCCWRSVELAKRETNDLKNMFLLLLSVHPLRAEMQTTGKAARLSGEARTRRVVGAEDSEALRDIFGSESTLGPLDLCGL